MRGQEDEGEENDQIFHLVPYKWFRRTQYIPELGVDYNVWGSLLGDCLTCEELVGVTWRIV